MIYNFIKNIFGATAMVVLITSCAPAPSLSSQHMTDHALAIKKINLNIDEIDEHGLVGPPDGRHMVSYEFCIPSDEVKRKEVSAIDPSVRFFSGSKGRIGCQTNQLLCIGEGGTRNVLLALASLDYIKRIDPFYGE